MHCKLSTFSMPSTTGRGAATRHLDWCRARNLRPGTIYSRHRVLTRLESLVGDLLEVTPDALEEWWNGLTARMLPESRAVELSHVREFYRWAVKDGTLTADPTLYLPRPRLTARLPNPMPQPEVDMALACAPERLKPWLYLATFAGLRCYEIAPLRADNLRFTAATQVILLPDTKGGGQESVSAPPVLVRALAGLPQRGWLFPRRDGKPGHITANLVSQLGNRYLHNMGIAHTMHSLRHWYGTEVYQASNRDLRQTQQALRHKSVSSTQRYTWVDPGELSDIVGRLPGAAAG